MKPAPATGSAVAPDAQATMRMAVGALSDKKALNLTVLNVTEITTVARYFVIATGTSSTHIKALADAVEDKLGKFGQHPYRRSGYASARWILLDYSDVVVHVFHEQDREFYGLERLWQDAELVPLQPLLSGTVTQS
jgi:ribosome-associated protein